MIIDSNKIDNSQREVVDLKRERDRLAIAEGLTQMEAEQGKPLDEAFDEMRRHLGFPPRQ